MDFHVTPVDRLINEFKRMPGIGSKTAGRLAFYVINLPREDALSIADAIADVKKSVRLCSVCQNISEHEMCHICASGKRDGAVICVTESPRDVMQMERLREFSGVYHVLHGAISPINDVGPDDIKIRELLQRIGEGDVAEVIMATNPNIEGEATAMYISKLLKPLGVKVTRIAHGVPVGGDLEFADEVTLSKALQYRIEL